MRRAAAALCATLALAGLLLAAQQDWHAAALDSFDAAWQTINDTFYDPHFGGLDWASVRAELRPKAEAAASLDAVRRVIREMLARLKQSHFQLLPSTAMADEQVSGSAIVPIDIRVAHDAGNGSSGAPFLIVTRVDVEAERAGLRPGDVITRIDSSDVSQWIDTISGIDDVRARDLELWKKAMRALYGPDGSAAALAVGRPAGTQVIRVARLREKGEIVTLGNLPPLHVRVTSTEARTPAHKRVGLIGFNIWMTAIDAPIAAAIDRYRKSDGLILDLRGNPGGLVGLMRGLSGHFFREPVLLGTSRTRDASLEFRANPRIVTADGRRVEPYAGPLAILVDGLTGSASECFAAALQGLGRARIFGQPTMGQALPASTRRLSDGDVLLYAIGDFLTGTGRRIEADGVTPDEIIPLSVESYRASADPVLAAALSWMDSRLQATGTRRP